MSIYCRILGSHPEDLGKTRVRMRKADMKRLGIQDGEIVKVTGGRPAHAFCLSWNDEYEENQAQLVFLDESSKSIPQIKASDQTYANLKNFHFGNMVEVEKSSALRAEKITIVPICAQNDIENRNYNLGWLQDKVLVSKGDRIMRKHEDPRKVSGFFVIDGKPDSHTWIVDKDTPFVICDKTPENLPSIIKEGGELTSVIPIVHKVGQGDFEATIPSVEVFENCMKIRLYVKDIIATEDDWASGLCTPTIRAWDDLGNKYLLNRFGGQSGGTQFGDAVWGKSNRYNFSEVSCILTPTLDKKARELTISIEQLMWHFRRHPMRVPTTRVEKGKPIMMTPAYPLDQKIAIHGGPWQFKVQLN